MEEGERGRDGGREKGREGKASGRERESSECVLCSTVLELSRPDMATVSGGMMFAHALWRFCLMFFASAGIGVIFGLISTMISLLLLLLLLLGGTGVRELTRGLVTLPPRWIQEPSVVRDRDVRPPRGPSGSALFLCV